MTFWPSDGERQTAFTFMAQNHSRMAAARRKQEGTAMLVLSRKLGERICIGDNICITVVDIDRGKIRLGIEAPREVPVFRQELLPADKSPAALHPEPAATHE